MTKPTPRFNFLARKPSAAALVDPLAPILTEKLADTPELRQHRELTGHYTVAVERVTALARELEQVKGEDAERRLAALSKGRRPAKPRADAVEAQLEEARGDVEMLAQVVIESATKLLRVAVPHLDDAAEEARGAVEAALDEVASLIAAATTALDRAEQLAGASGWLAGFVRDGVVVPWREGQRARPAPSVAQLLGQAGEALAFDRNRVADERERIEQERAEQLASLPPGTVIWQGPDTVVVGQETEAEDGER